MKKIFLVAVCAAFFVGQASVMAQKQQITFWTMSLKPKFDNYFEQLEKSYEAKNPNIDIVWVDVPWDVLQSKLVASLAAGKAPSLVNLNVPWAWDYVQQDLLEPLDSLIGSSKSMYASGSLKDLTFNGKIYGFPFYNGASVVIYNAELFKQAGIDKAPSSTKEILAVAQTIFKKTGKSGFSPTLGKMATLFLQEGLPMVKDGKAVFNSAEHQNLVKLYKDAYDAGALYATNLFAEDNFQTTIEGYNAGRLAIMVAPPTTISRTRDDAPSVYKNTMSGPAPLSSDGIAPGGWLFHFSIPKNAKEAPLKEVAKFALFLTDDENQIEFSKQAGTFPTTVKAGNSSYFEEKAMSDDPFEKAVGVGAKNMKHIRTLFVPDLPNYEDLNKKLQIEVEKSIRGKQSIKEGLDNAVKYWNAKL